MIITRMALPRRTFLRGLGTTLAIGSRPRPLADAGQPVATGMDDEDLQNYRAALAASDDDEHPLLAQDRQVRVQRIP